MEKEFDYTIYPNNSPEQFKNACTSIESAHPELSKAKLLIDVDGSTIQIYGEGSREIIVYDDYDVGAVYVISDVDLSRVITDYWDTHTRNYEKIAI